MVPKPELFRYWKSGPKSTNDGLGFDLLVGDFRSSWKVLIIGRDCLWSKTLTVNGSKMRLKMKSGPPIMTRKIQFADDSITLSGCLPY